jgi:hypothetical protein
MGCWEGPPSVLWACQYTSHATHLVGSGVAWRAQRHEPCIRVGPGVVCRTHAGGFIRHSAAQGVVRCGRAPCAALARQSCAWSVCDGGCVGRRTACADGACRMGTWERVVGVQARHVTARHVGQSVVRHASQRMWLHVAYVCGGVTHPTSVMYHLAWAPLGPPGRSVVGKGGGWCTSLRAVKSWTLASERAVCRAPLRQRMRTAGCCGAAALVAPIHTVASCARAIHWCVWVGAATPLLRLLIVKRQCLCCVC